MCPIISPTCGGDLLLLLLVLLFGVLIYLALSGKGAGWARIEQQKDDEEEDDDRLGHWVSITWERSHLPIDLSLAEEQAQQLIKQIVAMFDNKFEITFLFYDRTFGSKPPGEPHFQFHATSKSVNQVADEMAGDVEKVAQDMTLLKEFGMKTYLALSQAESDFERYLETMEWYPEWRKTMNLYFQTSYLTLEEQLAVLAVLEENGVPVFQNRYEPSDDETHGVYAIYHRPE